MDLMHLLVPLLVMTLLGIPHGALDGYVIKSMSRNTIDCIVLSGLYAGIAVVSIGIWIIFPTGAMLSFLAISAVHFGRSDIADTQFKQPLLAIIARGGLWAVGLPAIHWQTTEVFFGYLRTDLELVKIALTSMLIPWIFVSVIHLIIELRHGHRRVCIEWLAGLLLVSYLPPLWSLCLYFCGWHARRHVSRVLSTAKNARQATKDMLLFTAITLCIAGVVYFFYARHIDLAPAAITMFFVGLFALTVPHIYRHWRLHA